MVPIRLVLGWGVCVWFNQVTCTGAAGRVSILSADALWAAEHQSSNRQKKKHKNIKLRLYMLFHQLWSEWACCPEGNLLTDAVTHKCTASVWAGNTRVNWRIRDDQLTAGLLIWLKDLTCWSVLVASTNVTFLVAGTPFTRALCLGLGSGTWWQENTQINEGREHLYRVDEISRSGPDRRKVEEVV